MSMKRAQQLRYATHNHCDQLRFRLLTSLKSVLTISQAGLKLNIFGSLTGVFAGRRRKVTEQSASGTLQSIEHEQTAGWIQGDATGTMEAEAQTTTTVKERHRLTDEKREVRQKKLETVDHLGIEGPAE